VGVGTRAGCGNKGQARRISPVVAALSVCSLAGLQNLCHCHHAAACNAQRGQVHLAMLLEVALQQAVGGRGRDESRSRARVVCSCAGAWQSSTGQGGQGPAYNSTSS
jgi:hypothetical protein